MLPLTELLCTFSLIVSDVSFVVIDKDKNNKRDERTERDIDIRSSLRQVHHRSILLTRLRLIALTEGFHGTISIKFCMEVKGWLG